MPDIIQPSAPAVPALTVAQALQAKIDKANAEHLALQEDANKALAASAAKVDALKADIAGVPDAFKDLVEADLVAKIDAWFK